MSYNKANFDVGRLITFWSSARRTSIKKLSESMPQPFVDLIPERRGKGAVLKDALHNMTSEYNRVSIRPIKGEDGYYVSVETEPATRYSGAKYECLVSATVDDDDCIQVHDGFKIAPIDIQLEYNKCKDLISPNQVGSLLVKVCDRIGGSRLRENGGLYALPMSEESNYRDVVQSIESAATDGETKVYCLSVAKDADCLRAVRDSITMECNARLQTIEEELKSGKLGKRALNNRVDESRSIMAKLKEAEAFLGESLPDLSQRVTFAELIAASATMVASGESEPQDMNCSLTF